MNWVFLINWMPSCVLNNISPYEKLFHKVLDYTILRAFGCVCFPHLFPYTSGKLSFWTIPYVFIGYGCNHKGYKYLDPITKRIYMSRHVVFDEMVFLSLLLTLRILVALQPRYTIRYYLGIVTSLLVLSKRGKGKGIKVWWGSFFFIPSSEHYRKMWKCPTRMLDRT